MFPPVYEIVSSNGDVQSNLGSSPCRFRAFGEASENETKPYAVWQTVFGSPENYLNQVPDVDTWTIQIDIYGDNGLQVRNAAQALRDAIEPYAHITSFDGEGRDPETKNYRYTITVDWIDYREDDST